MLRWLLQLTSRRLRGKSGPAVTTLAIRGLRFTLDWAASEHVAIREIVARGEYWPTSDLRPANGDVVIDVGANAGVFSTVAGSWIGPHGRLVAVEPNPAVLHRLRRNLVQNGLDSRSTVVAAALSDRTGTGWLEVGLNTAIGSVRVDGDAGSGIGIALETLDHITSELDLPVIDFLKIDVEGLEIATLDGAIATLRTCRRLVLEVSHANDVPAVLVRCRAAGFDDIAESSSGPDSGARLVFARRSADRYAAPE